MEDWLRGRPLRNLAAGRGQRCRKGATLELNEGASQTPSLPDTDPRAAVHGVAGAKTISLQESFCSNYVIHVVSHT